MLTRRTKAYSSFCSQTVSLSPAISSQFILGVLQPKIAKVNEAPYFKSSGSFKVTDLDMTKKLITMIGSHKRLANNGKITTFTGVPLLDALVCRFH